MALSRTTSRESTPVAQDSPMSEAYFTDVPAIPTDPSNEFIPFSVKPRTTSHSLLSSSSSSSNVNRKARPIESGIVDGKIDRASMSMPPPLSNSTTLRRTSRDGSQAPPKINDMDKTPSLSGNGKQSISCVPLTLPESALRPQASIDRSNDTEINRLSFSSYMSLGSAVHSGTSANQSAASSTAGSMKGVVTESSHTLLGSGSLPSSFNSTKTGTPPMPTTAADPVSVTTASHSQQSGISPIK